MNNSGQSILSKEIMQKEIVGCYVSNEYEVTVENFKYDSLLNKL